MRSFDGQGMPMAMDAEASRLSNSRGDWWNGTSWKAGAGDWRGE